MNDKVINATIVGFTNSDLTRKHVEYKYSLGSIYRFIQLTNLPTDLAFIIYDYLNPIHIIDITKLKDLVYQIEFNRELGVLPKKQPFPYEENKFKDPDFTERLKYLIKNIIKQTDKNPKNFLRLSYINFKFIDKGKLYSLNLKFKKNINTCQNFSLKFLISDSYIGNQRKCNTKYNHNLRLCKFSH